jgi:hypothetical protein
LGCWNLKDFGGCNNLGLPLAEGKFKMKRPLLYLPFAFITFILGVVISPLRFWTDLIGCGYVPDGGGGFSVTRYTSSYFVKLWVSHAGYPSAEKADEVFQRQVNEAVKLIERTPKFDKEGRRVGERAVAIFYSQDYNEQYACVFWTDKTILHTVYSSSLMHVLDFEKNQTEY